MTLALTHENHFTIQPGNIPEAPRARRYFMWNCRTRVASPRHTCIRVCKGLMKHDCPKNCTCSVKLSKTCTCSVQLTAFSLLFSNGDTVKRPHRRSRRFFTALKQPSTLSSVKSLSWRRTERLTKLSSFQHLPFSTSEDLGGTMGGFISHQESTSMVFKLPCWVFQIQSLAFDRESLCESLILVSTSKAMDLLRTSCLLAKRTTVASLAECNLASAESDEGHSHSLSWK